MTPPTLLLLFGGASVAKFYVLAQNRVIMRETVEANAPLSEGEVLQRVADDLIRPVNRPVVLLADNISFRDATQQEIDDSGVDEERNSFLQQQRNQQIKALLDRLQVDATNAADLQEYFRLVRLQQPRS